MTNLQLLEEKIHLLTYAERDTVENYLIGILSVVIDPIVWADAVESALACDARAKEYARAVAPTKEATR